MGGNITPENSLVKLEDMSKRSISIIAVVAVLAATASVAWAATTIRYFQRIQQSTYTDTATVTITAGADYETESSPTIVSNCIMENSSSPTCERQYVDVITSRDYTTSISGLMRVNTRTDPPTFYYNAVFSKNGQIVNLPAAGTRQFRVKRVRTHTFADGHTTTETLSGERLPTTGTSEYDVKIVTLRPI